MVLRIGSDGLFVIAFLYCLKGTVVQKSKTKSVFQTFFAVPMMCSFIKLTADQMAKYRTHFA